MTPLPGHLDRQMRGGAAPVVGAPGAVVVDAGDDHVVAVGVARTGTQRVEPVGGEDDGGAALARVADARARRPRRRR